MAAKKIQKNFRRTEKKYLLTQGQYKALRRALDRYMQVDEYGMSTILSVYYDTEDYELIRRSEEKPVYKEKLRLRSYGVPKDGDAVFLEIKKKVQGVVYKRRVTLTAAEAAEYLSGGKKPEGKGQILEEIDWFLHRYRPMPRAVISTDRLALFGREDDKLRVTFDFNPRWRTDHLDLRDGAEGESLLPPGQVLMEVKLPQAAPLWLTRILSEMKLYPASFSKYGTCYREEILPGSIRKEVSSNV